MDTDNSVVIVGGGSGWLKVEEDIESINGDGKK